MEERGYIRECWSELWNPDNRVWQYIDRILFLLLAIIALLFVIISRTPNPPRWKDIMTNLAQIIPLSAWFLFLLLVVPYRVAKKYKHQRDIARADLQEKPKPLFLANRGALLRAIAEARIATIEMAENIEDIKLLNKGNIVFRDVETSIRLGTIQQRFRQACESLEKEILVAGSGYEPILTQLYLFMQSSAILNASPISSDNTLLTYKFTLERLVTEVRNKVDEISQSAPDKRDSPS